MNRAAGLMIARTWMNLCAIASFLVVAQFLTPEQFGVYALASAVVLLAMTVIGAGFGDHVIGRDPEGADTATAYWATAASGLALTIVAALAALMLQAFPATHDIGVILLYLSPLPVLWGSSAILEAILIRDNRALQMAGVTVAGEALALAALLGAVVLGWGVVSLVVSRIVNNLALFAGYAALVRPPPLSGFEMARLRALAKFCLGVVGSRIATWADGYGVEFVLAAFFSRAGVGLYRMGGRLNAALGAVLVYAPWQAQLAYMGERIRRAPHRVGAAVLRALQLHLSLVAPLFAGLALSASDLIALLMKDAWGPTADILAILAFGSLTQVVWGVLIAALVAQGRSKRMFFYQVSVVVCGVAAMAVGANWGLTGAALGKVALGAVLHVTGVLLIMELRLRHFLRVVSFVARIGLACAALAAAMLLMRQVAPAGDQVWEILLRLALTAAAGLAAYLTMLRLLAPEAVRQLIFVARAKWRGARPRMAPAEAQV